MRNAMRTRAKKIEEFKPAQLLQILVGVVFGYFTTFCNYMVSFLPTPDNLGIRVVMVLASTVFVAFGIFLYLPADLIPLAGEGAMQAVSTVTKIEFSKVKIGFDCTMVLVSVITCLSFLHNLGSVGAGTVIAAFLVGTLVGIINRAFGRQRDVLLGKTEETEASGAVKQTDRCVITISREFGSGGREIGKFLARQLGFEYYDSELIRLAAEKSGYSPEYIEQNEQAIKNPVLHDFFAWYAGSLEESELPKVDQLFQKESQLIRELAQKGSCIIVGRLANYILKDMPTAYHVFIGADNASKVKRVSERDRLSEKMAASKVKKVNHERAVHCRHFTKTEWGNVKNYNLCIQSNDFGIEETAQIIQRLIQKKMAFLICNLDKETWDRYGGFGGKNFADVPKTGKYTYNQRSIPYEYNPEAYHMGTFNNKTYFDKIDAIRDNDIEKLNQILTKEDVANINADDFEKIRNDYEKYIQNVQDELPEMAAPYGLSGEAAQMMDLEGGANQFMTPLKGDFLEQLGILKEFK